MPPAMSNRVDFSYLALPPLPDDPFYAGLEQDGRELVIPDPVPYMAPLIAGAVFDWVCLGIAFCQIQWWATHYHGREQRAVRLLVYLLSVMCLTSSGYVVFYTWWGVVPQYARYWQFFDKTRSSTIFILHALSRFPVGVFFAHRAYRLLNRSKIFLCAITALAITSLAGSIVGKYYFSGLVLKNDDTRLATYSLVVWLGTEVLGDILITASIAWCLARSKTGWSGTDRLIGKLLVMVVETQLPPTMFALAFILVFLGARHNTRFLIIFMGAPKVHVICVMAVLNRKDSLRIGASAESDYYRRLHAQNPSSAINGAVSNHGITVKTETHVQLDEFDPIDRRQVKFTNRLPVDTDTELDDDSKTEGALRTRTSLSSNRSHPHNRRLQRERDDQALSFSAALALPKARGAPFTNSEPVKSSFEVDIEDDREAYGRRYEYDDQQESTNKPSRTLSRSARVSYSHSVTFDESHSNGRARGGDTQV